MEADRLVTQIRATPSSFWKREGCPTGRKKNSQKGRNKDEAAATGTTCSNRQEKIDCTRCFESTALCNFEVIYGLFERERERDYDAQKFNS